jgi:tRNA nucleotidyltransferase/poly(A) polymerase
LQNSGAEAYFVGGYGRDLVMSRLEEQYPDMRFNPNDIDIATNLPYEQVKNILAEAGFNKTKEAGKNFGVLIVVAEMKNPAASGRGIENINKCEGKLSKI